LQAEFTNDKTVAVSINVTGIVASGYTVTKGGIV